MNQCTATDFKQGWTFFFVWCEPCPKIWQQHWHEETVKGPLVFIDSHCCSLLCTLIDYLWSVIYLGGYWKLCKQILSIPAARYFLLPWLWRMGMFGDIYLFSMTVVHLLLAGEKIKSFCSSIKLPIMYSHQSVRKTFDKYNASPFLSCKLRMMVEFYSRGRALVALPLIPALYSS